MTQFTFTAARKVKGTVVSATNIQQAVQVQKRTGLVRNGRHLLVEDSMPTTRKAQVRKVIIALDAKWTLRDNARDLVSRGSVEAGIRELATAGYGSKTIRRMIQQWTSYKD